METLWAPWRIEYIKEAPKGGCFLCDILRAGGDDRVNLVLKRGAVCAVVMNRYPYNNGHLMVAPYRHVARLADLTPEERLETMDLLDRSVEVLTSTIRPDGFNIGINLGRVAGAGLETHLHTHIVPRWNGDTNFMPVIGDTKVIPQALDDLWVTLRAAFG
ncbi:MAG: HIT domain-containing protein [Verrucomicrobia bacterium]|nr:HIT domain-containing protein [Verrucomicrobiota bacterium]